MSKPGEIVPVSSALIRDMDEVLDVFYRAGNGEECCCPLDMDCRTCHAIAVMKRWDTLIKLMDDTFTNCIICNTTEELMSAQLATGNTRQPMCRPCLYNWYDQGNTDCEEILRDRFPEKFRTTKPPGV